MTATTTVTSNPHTCAVFNRLRNNGKRKKHVRICKTCRAFAQAAFEYAQRLQGRPTTTVPEIDQRIAATTAGPAR